MQCIVNLGTLICYNVLYCKVIYCNISKRQPHKGTLQYYFKNTVKYNDTIKGEVLYQNCIVTSFIQLVSCNLILDNLLCCTVSNDVWYQFLLACFHECSIGTAIRGASVIGFSSCLLVCQCLCFYLFVISFISHSNLKASPNQLILRQIMIRTLILAFC